MIKEKSKENSSWNMAHEKAFIKGLGTSVFYDWVEMKLMLPSRQDLLLGYIEAIKKRTAWPDMDKDKILAYARAQLIARG